MVCQTPRCNDFLGRLDNIVKFSTHSIMELQDNLYDAEEGLELGITEPEAEEEVVRPPMSTCSLILLAIGFGG